MPIPGLTCAALNGVSTRVSISDLFVGDVRISPVNASAGYSLTSTGDVVRVTSSGSTIVAQWVVPTSAASAAYEVRASIVSGSVSAGTTGSWLSLGSTQTWTRTQTTIGSSTVVLTVEIRAASTGAVLSTATITLTAEKEP